MGDNKKADKKAKKKLDLKKETIQELNDEQLDRVAGGVAPATCSNTITTQAPGSARCGDTA
jgi:hypothetical protein